MMKEARSCLRSIKNKWNRCRRKEKSCGGKPAVKIEFTGIHDADSGRHERRPNENTVRADA